MIDDAVKALRQGKVICLYDYDNRERETDLVFAAEFSTPKLVYQLRRDAGGLMCVAIDPVACDKLGIPYITDVLKYAGNCGNGFGAIESIYEKVGDIPYDTKSSFSLWVNHRKVYTGITDIDRSLTIKELANITDSSFNGNKVAFGSQFRSPGHVPLLRCAPGSAQGPERADRAFHRARPRRQGDAGHGHVRDARRPDRQGAHETGREELCREQRARVHRRHRGRGAVQNDEMISFYNFYLCEFVIDLYPYYPGIPMILYLC